MLRERPPLCHNCGRPAGEVEVNRFDITLGHVEYADGTMSDEPIQMCMRLSGPFDICRDCFIKAVIANNPVKEVSDD